MPIDITMPRLSDTMETGTVIKWNKKVGDKVSPGDVLADIETDKATMELQAFDEGVLSRIVVPEGEAVGVGATIAVLAAAGEKVEERAGDDRRAEERRKPEAAAAGATARTSSGSTAVATRAAAVNGHSTAADADHDDDDAGDRIFASPLARKIAEESGVDLHAVKGSGPSGRIVRKDVEAALRGDAAAPSRATAPTSAPSPLGLRPQAPSLQASKPPSLPAPASTLKPGVFALTNMRRTIAKRLVESKTTIPHYQVTVAVNMDPLLALRQQLNEQLGSQGVKLSVNDFLVRACAIAMHQHPFVNSRWSQGAKPGAESIELLGEVNIGVAIALPIEKGGGLVVATLRNADRMGLRQISSDTKALSEKARTRGLTIEEMDAGTFTISNLGMFGVEHFTAIINPPQTAILAVGAAVKKPVARTVDGADQIVIGHEMQITMSSDHRVIDGAMAAQYLATVRQMLEAPATLLV